MRNTKERRKKNKEGVVSWKTKKRTYVQWECRQQWQMFWGSKGLSVWGLQTLMCLQVTYVTLSLQSSYKAEKTMAPHSRTLAWKIPWKEEPGGLLSMGSHRVGHDWATSLSLFTFMHWRRKWQPTPVFLPGESQGWGSLVGRRLWGLTKSDMTEVTQQQQHGCFCVTTEEVIETMTTWFTSLKWSFLKKSVDVLTRHSSQEVSRKPKWTMKNKNKNVVETDKFIKKYNLPKLTKKKA